jgi:transcriptional/translational regulatory protein YebC/TACO1
LIGEDVIEIYAPVESFKAIGERLTRAKITPEETSLRMEPQQRMALGIDETLQVMKVIESLEELDDVQAVYSNLQITDEAVAAMEAAE